MRARSARRSPPMAAGYIALRDPCFGKPWVSLHGHPLGGAKNASLKDTAEPMYPGGSRLAQSYSDHSLLTTHHSLRNACQSAA
jgi:hypothetical protein